MICNLNLEDTTYRDFYNRFDDVTINIDNRDIIVARKINFLLCESCFWCASCLNVAKRTVTKCPSCTDARLESMPISDNEIFKFEYNPERGVTLEFSKSDGVDRIRPKRILLKQDTSECYSKEVRTKGKGYL